MSTSFNSPAKQVKHQIFALSDITLCLPQTSMDELQTIPDLRSALRIKKITPQKNTQDWQAIFLQQLGESQQELPMARLRSEVLKIDPRYKTQVCCDLVAMQMTHRGAYLWGQQQLPFSEKDSQRIVDTINDKLMQKGECLVIYQANQWLYLNKKAIELKQDSYCNYIGRDMFLFNYHGEQAKYWQMLATEIQMLIKQMMDYQGLTVMPPEWIAQVHFSGNNQDDSWPNYTSKALQVFTDDRLLSTFCQQCQIPFKQNRFEFFSTNLKQNLSDSQAKQAWLLFNQIESDNLRLENTSLLIQSLLNFALQHQVTLKIIAGDQWFELNHSRNLFDRLVKWFRS